MMMVAGMGDEDAIVGADKTGRERLSRWWEC